MVLKQGKIQAAYDRKMGLGNPLAFEGTLSLTPVKF